MNRPSSKIDRNNLLKLQQTDNKSANRLLLIASIISFVCFFGSYMRIPIVPLFATSLGADTVQVGMINAAFMVMAGALSIPSGLASDRLGRRVPLLVGLVLLAASSFMLHWSSSPLQMAAIYLLFGIGLSAFSPTLMTYVADITPADRLGQAYGWYTMAMYGGMTLGPAAGGFLGATLGLRQVFAIAGGLILLMFFVAYFLLPTGQEQKGSRAGAITPALRQLAGNRRLVACLAATLGGCFGFGMFVTFMPLYIKKIGLTTGAVGVVFATQALSNAVSRIPAGRLYDRVTNRSNLVTAGMTLFAAALAAFGRCGSLPSLMAVAGLMGVSMGIAFTVISALITDVVTRDTRGLAMGCYNTFIYGGMMLCSLTMGTVIAKFGFRAGFLLTGAVMIVVLALFRGLYRR